MKKQLIINWNNLENSIKSIAKKYNVDIIILSKDKIYIYTSYNWLLDVNQDPIKSYRYTIEIDWNINMNEIIKDIKNLTDNRNWTIELSLWEKLWNII